MGEVSLRQMPIGGKKEIIPISNKDFGRRGECKSNSIQIGLVSRLILVTCIGYAHDYFTTFNPVQRKLVHFLAKKPEQIDDRVKPAAEGIFVPVRNETTNCTSGEKKNPSARTALLFPL